jgi:hypothetical protein
MSCLDATGTGTGKCSSTTRRIFGRRRFSAPGAIQH